MAKAAGGYPMLLVEWLDSKASANEWQYLDELTEIEPSRCRTVGFLLQTRKDSIVLAFTTSPEQVLGRLVIPSRAILKKQVLQAGAA